MKNIHVLPTDKPSRLCINGKNGQHIYITSDEEIKEGDWYLNIEEENGIKNPFYGKLYKANQSIKSVNADYKHNLKKIILTTDVDLIKDGVWGIDDEFLEWFVQNPSCEEVEVERMFNVVQFTPREFIYKIIIPKEEPNQETLEDKLQSLVVKWHQLQLHYQDVADENIVDEHTNRKFTYKAMATRDCWKELLTLLNTHKDESSNRTNRR